MNAKRIVAELTKNWPQEEGTPAAELISQRFERAIELNQKRGFALESWQFQVCQRDGCLTETIIAVFVKE
jgi:hypothetical protein